MEHQSITRLVTNIREGYQYSWNFCGLCPRSIEGNGCKKLNDKFTQKSMPRLSKWWWSLRAVDVELFHSVSQRVGMHFQNPRGTVGSIDDPLGLFEGSQNVFTLHFGMGRQPPMGLLDGSRFQRFHQPETIGRGSDDGALDDMLEFPDVAGPIVER